MNKLALAVVFISSSVFTSCNGANKQTTKDTSKLSSFGSNSNSNMLLGAGSKFVYPLFSKLFTEYARQTHMMVNYQSVGSDKGISQLNNKTIDFGDSDIPLDDEQVKKANGAVLQIPICAEAVVISYNLPGLKSTLKLTADVLAKIFLGKITRWNDVQIAKSNPRVKLPGTAVLVIHRSDGSAVTSIFTTYLSKVNNDWNSNAGKGITVNWPIGPGARSNEGVADLIKQTPGAIGYMDVAYALQNKMTYADIKNKSGNFITPTVASTGTAENTAMPNDAKASLSNTDAKEDYPISGFTWALIYKEQNYGGRSLQRAEKVLKLLWWNIHEGQKYCTGLNYAPLSPATAAVAGEILKSATFDGKPILQ